MKKNKRKNYRVEFLNKFKPIVDKHKDELPFFKMDKEYRNQEYETHSWFNISREKSKKTKPIVTATDKLDKCKCKAIKIKMILSDTHKQILQNWFNAYTMIYNKTLDYIRENFQFTKKEVNRDILSNEINNNQNFYNKFYIRNQMLEEKKKIQKNFSLIIDKTKTKNKLEDIKCEIDIHTLNKSIFQLVENIKACKTNMMRGNIKRFRLKYWKYNRPSKTMELEKGKITDGILCKSVFNDLEDIKYYYNNKEYKLDDITHDFKINYNSILDEYSLYIPISISKTKIENKRKIIILDPGLRTFMTGLSDYEKFNICPDVNKIIKKDIKRLNKVKNNNLISNKIKKKTEKIINRKIINKINDMHWKVVNFLTNNYDTIFLGDMSAKGIVAKSNKVLSKEMKTACLRTRYYEFRLRLKYKCSVTNTKFKLINECYTSKTCSQCGNYDNNLGGNKIYNCLNCKLKIDRDVNGCRNIYMKQFIK